MNSGGGGTKKPVGRQLGGCTSAMESMFQDEMG